MYTGEQHSVSEVVLTLGALGVMNAAVRFNEQLFWREACLSTETRALRPACVLRGLPCRDDSANEVDIREPIPRVCLRELCVATETSNSMTSQAGGGRGTARHPILSAS